MKRSRKTIAAFLLALVAVLAVTAFYIAEVTMRKSLIVEGFPVTLLDVLPSKQEFTTEKKWNALARKILPDRYYGWLPDFASSPNTGSGNGISIYLEISLTNSTHYPGEFDPPWKRFQAKSLAGEKFKVTDHHICIGPGASKFSDIYELEVDSFPRRDREFIVDLIGSDDSIVASLRVRNPLRVDFPTWLPRSIPQSATNVDVVLTLKTVSEMHSSPSEDSDLSAEFELSSSNPLWENAEVVTTTYFDATGNEGPSLSRQESAWRVMANAYRTDRRQILDEEKLVLTNVAVPLPGTVTQIHTNGSSVGGRFRVLGILGTGKHELTNVSSVLGLDDSIALTSFPYQPSFRMTLEAPALLVATAVEAAMNEAHLYVEAFDAEDHSLGKESSFYPSFGQEKHLLRISAPTTQMISRLEIFISHSKTFEFFINPADVKTNGPAQ